MNLLKFGLLLLSLAFMPLTLYGQVKCDRVFLTDGTEKQVFIVEVQKKSIKCEYPVGSGTISSIPLVDIAKIVYIDGHEEVFSTITIEERRKKEISSSVVSPDGPARVRLKNGTILNGTLSEIDPTSHITIIVADLETRIEMSEIEVIEGMDSSSAAPIDETRVDYPETYMLKVGPYDIEMILIKGATFSMGFDGRGSLSMSSEPVHDVTLNSFYVNFSPLKRHIVDYLENNEIKAEREDNYYVNLMHLEDTFDIVKLLAKSSSVPVKVISEAQWEYIATSDKIDKLDMRNNEGTVCQDYFADYKKTPSPQVDPVGPRTGNLRVIRCLREGNLVYHRYNTGSNNRSSIITSKFGVRFTFPASELPINQ